MVRSLYLLLVLLDVLTGSPCALCVDYETDEEFYPESSDDGSKGSSILDPLNISAADSFRREVDLVRLQQ